MNEKKTFLIVRNLNHPVYRLLLVKKLKKAISERGWNARFCDINHEIIVRRIQNLKPDFLLSITFSPLLSELGRQNRIPYFCWEYDKVMNQDLFHPSNFSPFTYFFATYLDDVRRLQAMGVKAKYLPPAPPIGDKQSLVPSREDYQLYSHDITHVGSSLIRVTNKFLDLKKELFENKARPPGPVVNRLWAILKQVIKDQEPFSQKNVYELPRLLEEKIHQSHFKGILEPEVLSNYLARECCRFQRLHFLEALRDHIVWVYGAPDWKEVEMDHIKYGGVLSYEEQAPKAYQCSKINLNIARIYCLDGMSDRVPNILSMGGFLLTNPIEGIEEHYEPGRELIVYQTAQELKELCAYFLAHPEERMAIGEAGRARVEKNHLVSTKLDTMMGFYAQNPP